MPSVTPLVRRLVFLWLGLWLLSSVSILLPGGGVSAFLRLSPDRISAGEPLALLGIIGYAFVHAPFPYILHVGLNSWITWLLGPEVERLWSNRRFVCFAVFATLAGAAVHLLLSWTLGGIFTAPALGGSGIVMAILGAHAAIYPGRRISLIIFSCPLLGLFLALCVLDLLGLLFMAAGQGSGVAADIHLAGGFFGWTWAGGWTRFDMPWSRWVAAIRDRNLATRAKKLQASNEEVDRILGKISDKGLPSLSASERKFLENHSKGKRRSGSRRR